MFQHWHRFIEIYRYLIRILLVKLRFSSLRYRWVFVDLGYSVFGPLVLLFPKFYINYFAFYVFSFSSSDYMFSTIHDDINYKRFRTRGQRRRLDLVRKPRRKYIGYWTIPWLNCRIASFASTRCCSNMKLQHNKNNHLDGTISGIKTTVQT